MIDLFTKREIELELIKNGSCVLKYNYKDTEIVPLEDQLEKLETFRDKEKLDKEISGIKELIQINKEIVLSLIGRPYE